MMNNHFEVPREEKNIVDTTAEGKEINAPEKFENTGFNRREVMNRLDAILEREILQLEVLNVSFEYPSEEEILEGTYEPNSSFEVNGVKYYTDDNGKVYRINDSLRPNATFEVNGYIYKTDEQGRVVSAEGKLKMRSPDYERKMEDVRKMEDQDYRDGDDRGHLIGHQFGGSDRLENLVPMDSELNQHGDFAKIEKMLADAVKDGAEVYVKIEPVYEGDSNRPVGFKITYTIDGETDSVYLKNGGDE